MTEAEFKAQYIVTFMASYTATRYDELCALNKHDTLRNHAFVEDAVHLADYAWEAYKKKDQGLGNARLV